MSTRIAENKFHRPLHEVTEDELILAIRKGHADAGEARTELNKRGWSDVNIVSYIASAVKVGG